MPARRGFVERLEAMVATELAGAPEPMIIPWPSWSWPNGRPAQPDADGSGSNCARPGIFGIGGMVGISGPGWKVGGGATVAVSVTGGAVETAVLVTVSVTGAVALRC